MPALRRVLDIQLSDDAASRRDAGIPHKTPTGWPMLDFQLAQAFYGSVERVRLGGPSWKDIAMQLPTHRVDWIEKIRRSAKALKGSARRSLFAHICRTYAKGSPRLTEHMFGWNRKAVARGLEEADGVSKKRP
jgi:hypothetical protein